MATMASAALIRSQEPGAFSLSLMRVQGPKHQGHPPLPSYATAESWTGRGAIRTESGAHIGCQRRRRRINQVLAREDIDEAVHAILFRENHAVKQLDTYIQHLDIFKERRKEMIHKKWVQSVADPLQQRIMEKVISYRGVEKMKQENFEHFLKHTNKTPGLGQAEARNLELIHISHMGDEPQHLGHRLLPPWIIRGS